MTDPVSGQMASQAVETAMQQSGGAQGPDKAGSAADFGDVMESSDGADGVGDPGGIDQVGQIDQVDQVDQVDAIEEVDEIPTDDFIQKLLSDEEGVQEMMDRCLSGEDMGKDEMLQMQAVIYSYSQRVELTSKVVDNATSGIKQVMNTQV